MQRRMSQATKRTKVPRSRPPTLIEADYAARLVAIVGHWRALLEPLMRELPALLESAARSHADRADIGEGRRVRVLLDLVRARISGSTRHGEHEALRYGDLTAKHGKRELARQ